MSMPIGKFVQLLRKAEKQERALDVSIVKMNEMLKPHTEFASAVVIQPGDGFCLINEDDGICLAPLSSALELIKKKGSITSDDLRSIAI